MNIISSIISAIFPPKCIVCDSILDDKKIFICPNCNSAINWLNTDFFSSLLPKTHFERGRSLAAYDGSWARLIHNLKYNRRTDLASTLGKMMAEKIDYEYDLIVPIPLHPKRLRERGYNQSSLLAKRLAKETGFLHEPELLKRIKNVPPQVGLEQKTRLENVKGCFACKDGANLDKKCVLLIDDVMTTGATVNECAKALKKAGAGRIDVFTLART